MLKRNSIINMDIANDEQQQLARKLKEFVGNARIRNINIKKKDKESIQNSALALLKGAEMV